MRARSAPPPISSELSDISRHACTLSGFPGVSAVAAGGHQLGSPAARDHFDPTRLVTLRRGATAHVFLRITNVAFLSAAACHPADAIRLKVFPPGQRTATVISFSFRACAKRARFFSPSAPPWQAPASPDSAPDRPDTCGTAHSAATTRRVSAP